MSPSKNTAEASAALAVGVVPAEPSTAIAEDSSPPDTDRGSLQDPEPEGSEAGDVRYPRRPIGAHPSPQPHRDAGEDPDGEDWLTRLGLDGLIGLRSALLDRGTAPRTAR